MRNFWYFLIENPKVFVSTIAVLIIQIAKALNLAFDIKPELLDAITAFIGLLGLIFAGKGKWPESPKPSAK